MDQETVTLVIGLAGIFSTLLSSSLGMYFTAKSRRSALRESLFNHQLELLKKIIFKQSRARVYFTILSDDDGLFEKEARHDVGKCIRDFSELEEEGAAILPVELWTEVKQLSSSMSDLLGAYDNGQGIDFDSMKEFVSRSVKVALLSRAVMGIDELSTETLKLYSNEKNFNQLANIEIEFFKEMYDRQNDST